MRTAILTDSGCDLSSEMLQKYGIHMIHSHINLGAITYLDRIEINATEILEYLNQAQLAVSTTPPSPDDFSNKFQELLQSYDKVLYISISQKISPIYQYGQEGAKQYGDDVQIIDSQTSTTGLGLRVIRAVELAQRGLDVDGIVHELKRISPLNSLLVTVDNLHYLNMTGRISQTSALFGSLLQVKSIMTIKNGTIKTVKRSIGQNRVFTDLKNILMTELQGHVSPRLAFLGTPGSEDHIFLLRQHIDHLDFVDLGDHPVGAAGTASMGPNAFGFCIEPE